MAKEPELATIAVYSLKGGVGKTTFAINLAWASATISRRRTLLWDLDPQGASSWLVSTDKESRDAAQAIFSKDVDIHRLVQPSTVPGLDLIAADTSLRGLDHLFRELDKKKRLAKLIEKLGKDYDRIILDCPPGLTETSEQVLRAADLIVIPVIPSPLSQRAMGEVKAVEERPGWHAIPMASAVEQMTVRRKPLGAFAPSSKAAGDFAGLWTRVERQLVGG